MITVTCAFHSKKFDKTRSTAYRVVNPSEQYLLIGGAIAHSRLYYIGSTSESGMKTVPSQLPFKFLLAPLLGDQTPGGPLRAFFRKAFVLHAPIGSPSPRTDFR